MKPERDRIELRGQLVVELVLLGSIIRLVLLLLGIELGSNSLNSLLAQQRMEPSH